MVTLCGGTAMVVAYHVSEHRLHRAYDISATAIRPATDSLAVSRGGLLARDLDCDGCHGDDFAGAVSFEAPGVARVVAPNLTVARNLSNQELELAIRHGLKPNHEGMIGMPSRAYYFLSDADVSALISFLKSLEPVEHDLPETRLGPLGRIGLVLGWFDLEPELIDPTAPRAIAKRALPAAYGAYVGMTNCGDCHGTGLGRGPDSSAARVKQYSRTQLRQYSASVARAWGKVHRFTEVGGWWE
jgi:mono/diheme cytochrome c family protein